MALEQILAPAGLFLGSNPHAAVPPGAMTVARNVVIRRPGVVEPRPGFQYVRLSHNAAYVPRRMFPYGTAVLYLGQSGPAWKAYWPASEMALPAGGNTFSAAWARSVAARGNLYLCAQESVVRVPSTNATTAYAVRTPLLQITAAIGGTPTFLATNTAVAVRAVVRRQVSATLETLGPPTSRVVVRNSSAGTVAVSITLSDFGAAAGGADLVAGDVIEVYRSKVVASTATPPDEVFRAVAVTLTSAQVTAGTVTLQLSGTDEQLGPPLYTSPSQEGGNRGNYAPPACRDAALYAGSVFYANVHDAHRLQIAHATYATAGLVTNADRSGQATGLGIRNIAGTTTSGSPSITGLANTTGLEVGMLVDMPSRFPVGTYITAIAGTTVTASANATVSGATTVPFVDAVHVISNGVTYRYLQTGTSRSILAALATGPIEGEPLHETVVNYDGTWTTYPAAGLATLVLRDRNQTTPFIVLATHGGEYQPPLTPTTGLGLASGTSTRANEIRWSKRDQPEHVPALSYALVGDDSAILRLVSTRDCLYIFKRDGLYRLSGSGEQWRIDPLDTTLRLLAPECACVLGGECYAWTSRGVVRVSEAGVEVISSSIETAIEAAQETLAGVALESAAYLPTFLLGNEKEGELLLQVPSPTNLGQASNTVQASYVYNTRTGAWTEWDLPVECGCLDVGWLSLMEAGWSIRVEVSRSAQTAMEAVGYASGDVVDTVEVVTPPGSTWVQIVASPHWTPAIGDALFQLFGGTLITVGVITEVQGDGVRFRTDLPVTAFDNVPSYAFRAFDCAIELQARTAGAPGRRKAYRDVVWVWERAQQLSGYTLTFRSSGEDVTVRVPRVLERTAVERPMAKRGLVPRQHARASVLYPGLEIRQALSRWQVAGVTVEADVHEARGTARLP